MVFSMKDKIINRLKKSQGLYKLYYYLFSFVLKAAGLFLKPNPRLILFSCFGGKKYDDSPKAVYEAIIKDERFKGYKFVWAFHDPEKHKLKYAKIIKTDNIKYFLTAMKAGCWVTNSSIERGLSFKNKNTLYYNSWHGTPIKKMGTDMTSSSETFKSKSSYSFDIINSQGRYETEIFSRCFGIPKDHFLECGLPRNDILNNYSVQYREKIRERLGISKDKKVILYCPTFRDYLRDKKNGCVLVPPVDLKKWKKELGDNYVLLFRAHYEVSKMLDVHDDGFVKNTTDYKSLNELMIASDILISDYSSVYFDYSITGKPMFHFTYDYDEYSTNRGMYFDIRDHLSGGDNEDELIKLLKSYSPEDEKERTEAFRNIYVNFYGNATKVTVDRIYKELNKQ